MYKNKLTYQDLVDQKLITESVITEEIICEAVENEVEQIEDELNNLNDAKDAKNILKKHSLLDGVRKYFHLDDKVNKESLKNALDNAKKSDSKESDGKEKDDSLYSALMTVDGFAKMSEGDRSKVFAIINLYEKTILNEKDKEIKDIKNENNKKKKGIFSKIFGTINFILKLPEKIWKTIKRLVRLVIIILIVTCCIDYAWNDCGLMKATGEKVKQEFYETDLGKGVKSTGEKIDKAMQTVDKIGNTIDNTTQSIKDAGQTVKDKVGDAVDATVKGTKKAYDATADAVSNGVNSVKEKWDETADDREEAVKKVEDTASNAWEKTKDTSKKTWNKVKGFFGGNAEESVYDKKKYDKFNLVFESTMKSLKR